MGYEKLILSSEGKRQAEICPKSDYLFWMLSNASVQNMSECTEESCFSIILILVSCGHDVQSSHLLFRQRMLPDICFLGSIHVLPYEHRCSVTNTNERKAHLKSIRLTNHIKLYLEYTEVKILKWSLNRDNICRSYRRMF